MLNSLFDSTSRGRLERIARHALGLRRGDHLAYARELERWLARFAVQPLDLALATGECHRGQLVWLQREFIWSDVAAERQASRAGGTEVRSSFRTSLVVGDQRSVLVHGSFNPARLTSSTSNVELRGTRHQFMLGHVVALGPSEVELRALAIATRLLRPPDGHATAWAPHPRWQRVDVSEVEQFAGIDFEVAPDALDVMRAIPEAEVKRALAVLIGEPTVPKDWGGEQHDLWTTRLRLEGRAHSAAFVLKGPAGGSMWRPMTIAMLGKNGDQLQRMAVSPAEVLVLQHCHEIRPEVVSMLESLASDMRNPRRFMVIDGYHSHSLMRAAGLAG
ncbi:hypothetical protein GCM10009740_16520 [Terrabacter terrae]|uniref:Uncharacterized protein n=1 Tax=Terrabacter terrae TaxID=318434 RepID=A0ABN2U486_9MICO